MTLNQRTAVAFWFCIAGLSYELLGSVFGLPTDKGYAAILAGILGTTLGVGIASGGSEGTREKGAPEESGADKA